MMRRLGILLFVIVLWNAVWFAALWVTSIVGPVENSRQVAYIGNAIWMPDKVQEVLIEGIHLNQSLCPPTVVCLLVLAWLKKLPRELMACTELFLVWQIGLTLAMLALVYSSIYNLIERLLRSIFSFADQTAFYEFITSSQFPSLVIFILPINCLALCYCFYRFNTGAEQWATRNSQLRVATYSEAWARGR